MQNLIKRIIACDTTLAKFLNTLSLMEYVGARKIMKSQPYQYLNKKILDHIAEEMRHAQILKRAATKLAPECCATYKDDSLLSGASAYQYFQTVDHAAGEILKEQNFWHSYLYTTFLIETRVLLFYNAFETELALAGKRSIFRGILAEEKNHLQEVSEWLNKIPDFQKNILLLNDLEAKAFETFLCAIEKNLLTEA